MNVLDIVFVMFFLFAIFKGYRAGLILEICGVVGVLAAAYISYCYAEEIAVALFPSLTFNYTLSFFIVFVIVLTAIGLAARIVSRVIDFTGMGMINKICGALASFVKMAIVLAVLVSLFNVVNNAVGWVKRDTLKESTGYTALLRLSGTVFPSVDFGGPLLSEEMLKNINEELGTENIFNNTGRQGGIRRPAGTMLFGDSIREVLEKHMSDSIAAEAVKTADTVSVSADGTRTQDDNKDTKLNRIINILSE